MVVETIVAESVRGPEFARLGSVQPIRQASMAIHREITVATADLKVRNGEGIIQSVYLAIRKDNLFCESRCGGIHSVDSDLARNLRCQRR